jgi:hypothetical protein
MLTSKRMAILLVSALLLASTRGWAADDEPPVTAGTKTTVTDKSLLGMIGAVLTNPVAQDVQQNCKEDRLYSQHDVVGDPDACFRSRYDVRRGYWYRYGSRLLR